MLEQQQGPQSEHIVVVGQQPGDAFHQLYGLGGRIRPALVLGQAGPRLPTWRLAAI